jgi:ABC-2 type transport system permease protein
MKAHHIFLYEFKHFRKHKSKVLAYLLFVLACGYALYNGASLQRKQEETILRIAQQQAESQTKTLGWFDEGKTGPEDRPWIDVTDPFWAVWAIQTTVIKQPSPLLPLGIGQAEQYAYYKQVSTWSSTYDNDMVEEMANPERLVNGNIDFSFLVIYLLPILLIILTYNIYGFEQDSNFDKLVHVQAGGTRSWILLRLGFYLLLVMATVGAIISVTAVANGAWTDHASQVGALLVLSASYMLFWAAVSYLMIVSSKGSSAIAFKMISIWLTLCVLIPGAVHQYASIQYPVNYMTDFLDASRKDAYEVYEMAPDTLSQKLREIYPDLAQTQHGQDSSIDEGIVGNTLAGIINQMIKDANGKIEQLNDAKNGFIASSYWLNPVSFIQNKWNNITATDYDAYRDYRASVQAGIDQKIRLLIFECWNKKKVDKAAYLDYSKQLQ